MKLDVLQTIWFLLEKHTEKAGPALLFSQFSNLDFWGHSFMTFHNTFSTFMLRPSVTTVEHIMVPSYQMKVTTFELLCEKLVCLDSQIVVSEPQQSLEALHHQMEQLILAFSSRSPLYMVNQIILVVHVKDNL